MMMMIMHCFCGMVDQQCLALFLASTIVRNHHHESQTCCVQVLNLRRTQALMNEVVQ